MRSSDSPSTSWRGLAGLAYLVHGPRYIVKHEYKLWAVRGPRGEGDAGGSTVLLSIEGASDARVRIGWWGAVATSPGRPYGLSFSRSLVLSRANETRERNTRRSARGGRSTHQSNWYHCSRLMRPAHVCIRLAVLFALVV